MAHTGAVVPELGQTLRRRNVAVVGAGISGLITAKCLLDEGLDPVVFEQAAQIGGLWGEVGEASLPIPPYTRTRQSIALRFPVCRFLLLSLTSHLGPRCAPISSSMSITPAYSPICGAIPSWKPLSQPMIGVGACAATPVRTTLGGL